MYRDRQVYKDKEINGKGKALSAQRFDYNLTYHFIDYLFTHCNLAANYIKQF